MNAVERSEDAVGEGGYQLVPREQVEVHVGMGEEQVVTPVRDSRQVEVVELRPVSRLATLARAVAHVLAPLELATAHQRDHAECEPLGFDVAAVLQRVKQRSDALVALAGTEERSLDDE